MTYPDSPSPRLLAGILNPAFTDQPGSKYRAYPSLKTARWILPVAPTHRRSGIAAYRPVRLSGILLKALLTSGLLRGKPAPGATQPLERLRQFIGAEAGIPNSAVSLTVGTPGAYQKYALRIMRQDGSPIGYAKLADRESSKRKLIAEHAALIRLSSISALEGQVPKVLFIGDLDDCHVIVTTAGPDTPGPRAFSKEHVDFLRTLHLSSRVEKPLLATEYWGGITTTLDWLSTEFRGALHDRLASARDLIVSEFAAAPTILSTIYRDFAPWNTCSLPGQVFVFDWEDSAPEAPPLHDVFHFHAIQQALSGRPLDLNIRLMDRIAGELGIDNRGSNTTRTFLVLYLLDIAAYYLRAKIERPQDGDLVVLKWAERALDAHIIHF